jgi:glutaminyl-tRNA synthetase
MPTLAGMRRRGVTPEALREFAELIGVAKNNSLVDIGKLEFAIRGDLERRAPRAMAVLSPLPLVIANWPGDRVEELEVPWWPGEPERGGSRKVPFGRELLVEREDFSRDPLPGWKRLAPGREVRLAGAYLVRCDEVVSGPAGEVLALRCSYDPGSMGGDPEGRRRASGTLHWVHASLSVPAEVRLYDRLFTVEQPDAQDDLLSVLNPDSLLVAKGARVEAALGEAAAGSHCQFLRQGYFFADPKDSRPGAPVFNRTISLKDTWASRAAARPGLGRAPVAPRAKREAPRGILGGGAGHQGAAGPPVSKRSRAELQARNPALGERFARYQAELGLDEEQSGLVNGDEVIAAYFEAAVAAGGNPRSVARWLANDLLGLAKHAPLGALRLGGAAFGRFVALVDAGRVSPAAGKALLASLVERGGEAEARMRELSLEKVDDEGAIGAAVDRALAAQQAEVERYRAGEKKLFGVLVGAVMRETKGAAEAAVVRKLLQERLG